MTPPADDALQTFSGVVPAVGVGSDRPNPDNLKQRQRQRRYWTWALLWTILWHLGWLFFPSPTPSGYEEGGHPQPVRAVLRYEPVSAPAGHGRAQLEDILRVNSPGVFAMPREDGFSASFFQRRSDFAPPVSRESGRPVYVDRPDGFPGQPESVLPATAVEEAARRLMTGELPVPVSGSERAFSREVLPSSGIRCRWEGLQPVHPVALPVPVEASRAEAVFLLTVDASGYPSRVMPEKPSPLKAWNQAVMSALRQTVFSTAAGVSGQVTVEYVPPVKGDGP